MHILTLLKAQAGKLRGNLVEVYTLLLVTLGLPTVAYIYVDWRLAVTVFVLDQTILGFLYLRNSK